MVRFRRYELRTTDVSAARAFYTAVFGEFAARVVPLAAEIIARGARPHWLGHLGVDDVERAATAFVERGAERLGPTRAIDGGGASQILRDPGGAVVAVSTLPGEEPETAPPIRWHSLNSVDLERSKSTYCELFGWELTGRLDLGVHGTYPQFAWEAGGASVGTVAATAGRPGVHPHWLFHFKVDSVDRCAARVRAEGGLVLDPIDLPAGGRVAVCDDPQGAAFALDDRPLPAR